MTYTPGGGPGGLLRRALTFLRPHRGATLLILGLTCLVSAAGACEPLLLKRVFDGLAEPAAGTGSLLLGVAALSALALGREGLSGLAHWLTWRTRIRIHQALMEDTVERLHRLPVAFHQREGVGATLTRLERGVQGFVGGLCEVAFKLVPALLFLSFAGLVMLLLDWRLALVALAFAPLPWLISSLASPEQVRRERDLLGRWARIYARFNEVLAGILTVKSYTMEEAEQARFLREVRAANAVVVRGVRRDTGVGVAQNLVTLLAQAATIGVGGALVLRGQASLGTLVAFMGYLGGLFQPVRGLSGVYESVRRAGVALEQVFEVLDAQDGVVDRPGARDLTEVRGEVRFEGVHFRYGPDAPSALEGIDLTVRPGERVALVGPSGAGKTTLVTLLQRFYDPCQGRVLLDGVDLREVRQRSLRAHVGCVHQEPLLFDETVRDNIAWGRPAASREEIEAAARAAQAHEFIVRLPQGYETPVGERGCRLSVGQRQRIGIARVFLRQPALLILDEPTSALDAESEAAVQQALETLLRGRTCFTIAHRLSTVFRADRILVFRAGRIVEQGTHPELLGRGGHYAALVRLQADLTAG